MFIVSSYTLAVILCTITMICWGSWGNTQKLAARSWRYELFYWDYVIGMVIFAAMLGLTFGSHGAEGRSFIPDLCQGSAASYLWILLGGIIFNASNILLSASISLAGMSVAFPIGVGLALVLGVIVNYIGLPKGDPVQLFGGVFFVVMAIIANAVASGKMNKGKEKAKNSTKGIVIALVAGVLMSLFYRFVVMGMDIENFRSPAAGMLTPYSAIFIFSVGVLLSNFVFNTLVMKYPFAGEKVSYNEYFKGSVGTHLVGMLGGCIWCMGSALSYISSGEAGPAISYALGQGAPLVAALWGVFIWKEFKGSTKRINSLLTMMFLFFILGLGMIITAGKDNAKEETAIALADQPQRIIFDTDMGNDVDDAMAMDLLYKYMNAGKIDLLGVMLNKEGIHQPEYIDILNTWYGYPEIPIGIVHNGKTGENAETNFGAMVCKETAEDGSPLYARSLTDYENLPDAHNLYRKILAAQPDSSVTIVSVGFSTNLQRLMETGADEYSPLTGADLIAKKVNRLITMAGNIVDTTFHEYNVVTDVPAAQKVFAEWPTPVITSPFELGNAICYPGSSIENDFSWAPHHPMVDAFQFYMKMPYDRPTWDVTATLYALEGADGYFTLSAPGRIAVTDAGSTVFTEETTGNRYYLSVDNQQKQTILNYFLRVVPTDPKTYIK